jgi:cytochrome c biogenesis DsbD-like protein
MKGRRLTILSLLCAFAIPAAEVRVGPKGAAILFDGSKAQMAELEEHRETFRKLGVEVAAQNGNGSGWIILDAKHTIIAKYDPSYTSAAILVHQFGWTPEQLTEIEGKQLTARIGASNSSVAPGKQVTLTLDVELMPNMHVYAPGVEGYIPIDWKMQDSGAVEVQAPVFPRAEKLYLKAIDETVPAYRDHFRLLRDITIAAGAPGRFTIDGSLRYQACDDRVCYIPQTLALHWTFERP